ncbi:NAD+ synthase [Ponticaulis sp.]|uniref:NAD+ synthase n=1 Tax=Ponticaulis sp. TaxID=2020902 RepID=UPI000B6331AD|nr:NAD+ synthase [Ponticaulis sp.]MAI92127.1 NAD+ synthase [Ponticaulis sp.]OUX96316.1 MAG: NAD+ synthase [Hyphomonadaceae bacterium TMED5]
MANSLNITIAQLNPIVGDVSGNLELARGALAQARQEGSDLLVFSELFLLGYPPEDLVLKPRVAEVCAEALFSLHAELLATDPAILIGAPYREDVHVYNSAFLLQHGENAQRWDKHELPDYGVFDDSRVFTKGELKSPCFDLKGVRVGVAICEDIWYRTVPEAIRADGANLLLALNASPWRRTIHRERRTAFSMWEGEDLPYIFINQIGAQDELVFDGASYAWTAETRHSWLFPDFAAGVRTFKFDANSKSFDAKSCEGPSEAEKADYQAAVLALGDYVRKNRFPGVLIGLSGGIDSALTAAIAVDALGADKVWCVMLPSKYTSDHSLEDAKACAEALGIRYDSISIAPGVNALDEMLLPAFEGREPDTAEENIQSRLRGVTLMALSNKFGHMVVTTGNKSEMAVGYATLYGDMCGGYNPLKDFYKTEVFQISKWRNECDASEFMGPTGEVIPERIITKPPSAELREDQKDEDSLPPYEVLDDILRALVDFEQSVEHLIERGHDRDTVKRIEHLLYISEYKRRQSAPGPKIGPRNFGRDRRYPITSRWRDA